MRKSFSKIILFMVILLALSSTAARSENYIDVLFAPPTQEELDKVWDATRYQPACKNLAIGDVFKETENGTLYKITYSSDGYKQTGFMGRPNGDGPFPVAVLNHFGFGGVTLTEIDDAMEFIKRGYLVAMPTYRGEVGLGGQAEGPVDVLGDEVHDVLNLMECAAAQENADPDRMVMMGVSHGGGLTLSALGHTDRIRAAATMAAPLNLMGPPIKDMVITWIKQPSRIEVILQILVSKQGIKKLKSILGIKERDAAKIPANREELLRRSPAMFADRFTVPMLMYLGDQDPVSFPEDAQAVAASLNSRGIFAKATVFENQSHAISPESSAGAKEEIFEFFDKVLNDK